MTLPTGASCATSPRARCRATASCSRVKRSRRVAAAGIAANVALWAGALMPVWITARRAVVDERPEVKTLWWLVLAVVVVMAVAQEQSKFKLLATNRTSTMQVLAGQIVNDIVRLCLLPPGQTGGSGIAILVAIKACAKPSPASAWSRISGERRSTASVRPGSQTCVNDVTAPGSARRPTMVAISPRTVSVAGSVRGQ